LLDAPVPDGLFFIDSVAVYRRGWNGTTRIPHLREIVVVRGHQGADRGSAFLGPGTAFRAGISGRPIVGNAARDDQRWQNDGEGSRRFHGFVSLV
jgi:hypothetical protein